MRWHLFQHFAGSSCWISMNFLTFVRVPEQLNHRNWEYSKKHVQYFTSSNHHVLICSATWSWDLFKANGQWDTNFCQVHRLAATLPLEMISCTGNKKNQNRHGNLNQSFHVKVSYFDAHTFEFDGIWVLYVHELIRLNECLDWFDQNYSIFHQSCLGGGSKYCWFSPLAWENVPIWLYDVVSSWVVQPRMRTYSCSSIEQWKMIWWFAF